MTSSTPKNSVNPTAIKAYIMPSITPLNACWSNSSTGGIKALRLGLPLLEFHTRQRPLPGCVLRVLPDHPLAILAHVLGDERDGVLTMGIELHRADDGVGVLGALELGGDLGPVRANRLDGIDHEVRGHVGEGAIDLRRLLEAGLGVGLEECLAAGQLLRRGR